MTADEAIKHADRLNLVGKNCANWFYFPAWHHVRKEWFVALRPKDAVIHIAIFANGTIAHNEQ